MILAESGRSSAGGARGGLRLYGTTSDGGGNCSKLTYLSECCGTVIELASNADRLNGLKLCCTPSPKRDCGGDVSGIGVRPRGLIMGPAGTLYRTTAEGGDHRGSDGNNPGGSVFALTPNADQTRWTMKTLYSFCGQIGTGLYGKCADGEHPQNLIMDAAGMLYGTTIDGGTHNAGTVFVLTPNADKSRWTETVLHSFCAQSDCADGLVPQNLVIDASGLLYGTTGFGSTRDDHYRGTVFELR